MVSFGIRFLACNFFVAAMVGVLLLAKYLLRSVLSGRMQYHLWFLMLGLLAVPFLPVRPAGMGRFLFWMNHLYGTPLKNAVGTVRKASDLELSHTGNWLRDFGFSVERSTPAAMESVLVFLWLTGILVMFLLLLRSALQLHQLRNSAHLLQNPKVNRLYHQCLKELQIRRDIPLYSSVCLTSPVMAGCLRPAIYLPLHLISDYDPRQMRYMLLHELQHYRHLDGWISWLMNLAGVLYWFNPLVRYGLRERKHDREIACDTSVLNMLDQQDYYDYGNTLIDFAEKMSQSPFPFASGMGGTIKQMKRRIMNIASYQMPSRGRTLRGCVAFGCVVLLLSFFIPALSIYAEDDITYHWDVAGKQIFYDDVSSYFRNYNGSFVLYDTETDAWIIYNREEALHRSSPYSTYKIYGALLGLEAGVISPEASNMAWNGEHYPMDTWNRDQDLHSAMSDSVNWYFQAMDQQAGAKGVSNFIRTIGYGNQKLTGESPSYWLNSDLKISPVEQVELLKKLDRNEFHASPEHVQAVKDSIRLASSDQGSLYGKTGTGMVDGSNHDGWFVGYAEYKEGKRYFAVHIQNQETSNGAAVSASGNDAARIALSILSDLQWESR